jgi:hypothetical protein
MKPFTYEIRAEDAPADDIDFRGVASESHLCVDCGMNTAPGMLNRAELEDAAGALGALWKANQAGIKQTIGDDAEVYMVRDAVWKKTGLEGYGGCLCIGCLEKRIGRRLKPKDFVRDHAFNEMPGTARLRNRRGNAD